MSSDTLAQVPTAPLLMVAILWYAVVTSLLGGTGDAR